MIFVCEKDYTLEFKEGKNVEYKRGKSYRIEEMRECSSLFCIPCTPDGKNDGSYNWIHKHQVKDIAKIFGKPFMDWATKNRDYRGRKHE